MFREFFHTLFLGNDEKIDNGIDIEPDRHRPLPGSSAMPARDGAEPGLIGEEHRLTLRPWKTPGSAGRRGRAAREERDGE